MKTTDEPSWAAVPGPAARDMMRGFRMIRANPLRYLEQTRARYGDLVAFPVPGPPALLLSDPDDVRQVLQTSARHWTKDTVQYRALGRVTGPGLLASSEPNWIEHRRAAAPAFHHQRLDAVGAQIADATDAALKDWPSAPQVLDVAPLTLQLAMDVVGRTLLSADLSIHAQRLLEATNSAAKLIVRLGRAVVPVPPSWPTPLNRRLATARRNLDALCLDLIETRRGTAAGDDLLGLLIDSGLSDQEIRDELVTMIVAGHETVAASLAWTLMLLAEDESAQERVRAEARGLTGPVCMTATAGQAPWTRAVVDETLRLYPPAWVISRRSRQPDRIGGHDVPPGTTAIISPWLLHRRTESWPAPEDFRPERFLQQSGPRADYLPFGIGPRLCIGREFALGEMVIVLFRILADYRLQVPAGWSRPRPEALIAAHPHGGMPLTVTPV
ncbi:cytochrome P450 [Kribbella albertanoniae]|uniref:Cytochrome P450 n=1 Tax=Kribbella albertanoniae TaxID=1266829 RepID=A0A4R4P841_9ACTN|nr:cytochrome P450 [Kribbella albertanoniae]TDC18701.1 cytochrome P450 [Kribbella albertanoniae]